MLASTASLTTAVTSIEIGDPAINHTFEVRFDDVNVQDTSTPSTDTTPPTAPSSLTANATSPHRVDLSWTPASDNVGVTGYDVYRDGTKIDSVAAVTTYTDKTAPAAQTLTYQVQARDAAGNISPLSNSAMATTPPAAVVTPTTKVLTIVEENHSYAQMIAGMPYLSSLANQYGYATNWTAITHPSLPNYLAIVGGSTFGITNDMPPSTNAPKVGTAQSIFDQALDIGKTAATYAESMPSNCALTATSPYVVKHNPWAYFSSSSARCNQYDVPLPALSTDVSNGTLPNVGLVIPNMCNDAHNCSLSVADNWLKTNLGQILAGPDFTSGALTVVVTADENDGTAGNTVLTVVMHQGMSPTVVSAPLTHFSLTRYYAQVLGVTPLGAGAAAPDMKTAFGL
jgi:acid phosphatase